MEAPWTEVADLAARNGLALEVRPTHDGTIGVFVSRAEDHGDWSLQPTKIAIGRSPLVVASNAIAAIKEMAPRLQKALDAASPEPPDMRIAAGVGSDGVVTALRVERDGTVRLHPEDIEVIAEAVAQRIRNELPASGDGARTIHWPVVPE